MKVEQEINISNDGQDVNVKQKVENGNTLSSQQSNITQTVTPAQSYEEKIWDLEKQLHEQYAINNNSKLGSLIAIITALVGVFACYGYVFVYTDSLFATGWGHLLKIVNENAIFHLDVLLLTAGATFLIISILYSISLYLGVNQRKEQFIAFSIRLKAYKNHGDWYREIFPKNYCPIKRNSCMHKIAQGLYGKFCNILVGMHFIVFALTLLKVLNTTCYCGCNCCCSCKNSLNTANYTAIIIAIIAMLCAIAIIVWTYFNEKKKYNERVDAYVDLFRDKCPYSNKEVYSCDGCKGCQCCSK